MDQNVIQATIMVNLDDLNDIIEGSDSRSDKPDNIADQISDSIPIPAGLTHLGGIDDDLQVPVKKADSPILDLEKTGLGPEIDDSKPKANNNAIADFSDLAPRHKLLWGWIVGGSFLFLLLGVTIYFFFSRVSFNQGTLNLTFEPVGVDVVIDGKFKKQSVSSLTIKLKSGDYTILVTKEGYLDFERMIGMVSKEQFDLNVILQPIPNLEVLVEGQTNFAGLIRNNKTLTYLSPEQEFMAIGLDGSTFISMPSSIFQGAFNNLQSVKWSPGDPAAIIKIRNVFKLNNMADNRNVIGRFIPFGESPKQGLPFNNGVSTWLFEDSLRTAKGWQPILLNESVREVDFSPDGSQIIYFYETADGEKSLVVAHPDGSEWERIISNLKMQNPQITWLKDERYVLLYDDQDLPDKVVDLVTQELIEVMPDRTDGSLITGSPNGERLAYVLKESNINKLAIWNIASRSREYLSEEEVQSFTWKDDSSLIVAKNDNTLWYLDLTGKKRPVKFVSTVGDLLPQQLLYSKLLNLLLIIDQGKILKLPTN